MRPAARIFASLSALSLLALFGHTSAAQQSAAQRDECCRIEGEVVELVGGQYRALVGVTVELRRNEQSLDLITTSAEGRYSVPFGKGDPIDIMYYGDNWMPAKVAVISGRRNHRITKVIKPASSAGLLPPGEAGEVLAALEYMNSYPAEYGERLGRYTSKIKQEGFPPEFRERLQRIEQAVADRRKDKPAPPTRPFTPPGLTSPISLDEAAAHGPRRGGLRFEPPPVIFVTPERLRDLNLPPEVERLRQQASEAQAFIFAPHVHAFAPRVGMSWDVTGRGDTVLRGGYGIFYAPLPRRDPRRVFSSYTYSQLDMLAAQDSIFYMLDGVGSQYRRPTDAELLLLSWQHHNAAYRYAGIEGIEPCRLPTFPPPNQVRLGARFQF